MRYNNKIVFDVKHQQNYRITTITTYKGLRGKSNILLLKCLNDKYYLQEQQIQEFTFDKLECLKKFKIIG